MTLFRGSAAGMGWLLGGTPEFLLDTRRGLTAPGPPLRLEENTFATAGLVDYSGPVLRLANLSQEVFYVLLTRLRNVYAGGDLASTSCLTTRSAPSWRTAPSASEMPTSARAQHHQGVHQLSRCP